MLSIYIGNSNIALLNGVKTALGEVDDGATITITLYESDGTTEVVGQLWPASMYNEPDQGGRYGATLENDLVLSLNHTYIAEVNGLGSNSEVLHIREKCTAVNRGSDPSC